MKSLPESCSLYRLFLVMFGLLVLFGRDQAPAEDNATPSKATSQFGKQEIEFFEAKIRPVLVEHCYPCHSSESDKLQGGFLLDSREGILAGGDTGKAVVVGRPADSLLIEAMRHESYEMPPDKRLPDVVIADFERWIRDGLADPRARPQSATPMRRVLYSEETASTHWAFQPLGPVQVPPIDDPWIRTPIDAFVLAKLQAAGLKPSSPAAPRILLRRISYDLTGLPPSVDDVTSFESDHSSHAYASAVERLLDSPRYGEKWARHWLDVARYADTNGQRPAPTPDPPFFPFAWVYRDYVISAFNRDLPFDQFIVEQLAGDAVATDADCRPLAALGFLRVGKTFGGNLDDRIDDRIDVITKSFLGLTVSCARCHDHKLDPISQEDYYAIHGVFASSEEFDAAYIDTVGTLAYQDFLREKNRLSAEIESECLAGLNGFMHRMTLSVADAMVSAERFRDGELTEKKPSLAAREVGMKPILFTAWLDAMQRWESQQTPAYRPWFALAALPKEDFAARSAAIVREVATGTFMGEGVPALIAKHFADQRPKSLRQVAEIYQAIFLDVERAADGQYPMAALLCAMNESPGKFRNEFLQHPALPSPLNDPDLESLRQVTIGFDGPYFMSPRELMQAGASQWRKAMVRRMHEVDRLAADHPGAPIKAMGMRDRPDAVNSPVYIRGDSKLPGDMVPRRFLQRLSDGEPAPFTQGSGRFELASAIASADNPLTARVIVNRIWQWHFGRGLVTTPSDFGLSGEPPTHPELLDWLANRFIDDGWSIKSLHRLIMNSNTYKQSSLLRPAARHIDSENLLYWRMSPRRMTFEELRDTWLTSAGAMKHQLGGRPVDPLTDSSRRSVYLLIDRYRLPNVFSTFDFATPEFTTSTRDSTIIPQQSLFAMNSQWLIDRAGELARRDQVTSANNPAHQVEALFSIVYQRPPTEEETKISVRFLDSLRDLNHSDRLSRLAHALLQTNESSYVH